MANFTIKEDLLKLKGAFVTNIKGKTETKRCLVIPIDDSGLFAGEKGVYLNLTATELREPKYEDTHCLKVQLDREAYNDMTDEERRAIPIIGGMHEFQTQTRTMRVTQTLDAATQIENPDDDLPF